MRSENIFKLEQEQKERFERDVKQGVYRQLYAQGRITQEQFVKLMSAYDKESFL